MLRAGEEDVAAVGGGSGAGEVDVVGREKDLIFGGSKEGGLHAGEKEADDDAPERERVREDVRLPVHHHQADEEEAEDGDADVRDEERSDI